MKIALCIFSIAICFIRCGSPNGEEAATGKPDTASSITMTDTTVKGSEPEKKQNDHFDGSEINDYTGLPLDSMQIQYRFRWLIDTLYGYRNNDTLLVEGDIKVVYPRKKDLGIEKGIGRTDKLWRKNADGTVTIPYKISADYKFKPRIITALEMWQNGLPNIRFVEQTSQTDYIVFVRSKYTQSFIGKQGRGQSIELQDEAMEGNIAHEIGHALGLYHEHSRSDRDKYVNIVCPRDINYAHAYKANPYTTDIGPYNYNSIMHYPETECLKFPSRLPADANPGQRVRVSPGDFDAIKRIYRLR